jgi:tetratricopeptide (TPR) repeat protein
MSLYERRGMLHQNTATLEENAQPTTKLELTQLAAEDYRSALKLHPYNPIYLFNLADMLTFEAQYAEARKLFQTGLALMGDMEPAFHGHHRYAESLLSHARAEKEKGNLDTAKASIDEAVKELGTVFELHNPWGVKGYKLWLNVHTARAMILEDSGDYAAALQQYEAICLPYFGASGHFLTAFFYASRASDCQKQGRSADALRLFMESEQRMARVSILPDGVTPEIKAAFQEYIRSNIKLLTDLAVKPSAQINF